MSVPLLPVTLATVLFAGMNTPVRAQEQGPESKVRIEVITTENGETKRVTKEFDADDEAAIEDALREMGVMQHFSFHGGEGDLRIDIRDFDGLDDLGRAAPPAPPLPPLPPMPPSAGLENKAWLGVSTTNVDRGGEQKEGAHVQHVVEDSPAAELGLQEGDVITMIGDVVIKGPGTLVGVVRDHAPGDQLKVTWLRGGKKMSGTVRLAKNSNGNYQFHFNGPEGRSFEFHGAGTKRAFLGVTPAEEAGDVKGAAIGTVEEGSAAAAMGLQAGDVIRKVNDAEVSDFAALSAAIRAMAPGDAVAVTVERDGKSITLNGTLGEREGWTGRREFRSDGKEGMNDELHLEMDMLRRDLDRMREELDRDGGLRDRIRREMRITIQSRPLEQTEKDLLTKKGVAGLDKELDLGDLRCFPNPSNGFFRLQFDVPERGDLLVTVHDSAGEKVYDERISGFKGRYERTLDLSDKAAGTYYLVIAQGGRTATQKLVKQ